MRKTLTILFIILTMIMCEAQAETLRFGMKGEEVRKLQKELIEQNYLTGKADGIFGPATEEAVRRFQKTNKLKVDGLAGPKTQEKLYNAPGNTSDGSKYKSYFSGDYSTISEKSDSARIRVLQKVLQQMNYLRDSADGVYGTNTKNAVCCFQQGHGLRKDGIAGENTLKAIERAASEGHKLITTLDDAPQLSANAGKISAPDKSSIKLLKWFTEIKPKLKAKAKLTIYEPSSGLGWNVIVHSKGRHCDVEPETITDTQIMMKAFNQKNTWTQKGVYVLLPDGTWTVGSTHSVPHLTGYIKDNGLDGHVCIHFFRELEECQRLDPNYGVSNQRTIRNMWKKVSGETIEY